MRFQLFFLNKNNFISFQLGLWNNNKNERELAPRSIQFGLANRSEGKALQLGLLNFNTSEDAFLPFCPFFNYN